MAATYAVGSDLKATKRLNDPYRDNQGEQQNDLLDVLVTILNRAFNSLAALNGATIASATTNGKLKTVGGTIEFNINGERFSKAATDNFWDFTAEVDVAALRYRAYYLYIDNAGNASFHAATTTGTDPASAALAKAALLAGGEPAADKCCVGVFVAGPGTDMSMDALLGVAGATIQYGIPETMKATFGIRPVIGA